MIPPEFRDKNKRMLWSMMMDEQGNVNPPFDTMGFQEALNHLLPHTVVSRYQNGPNAPADQPEDMFEKQIVPWLKANCAGTWQLWVQPGGNGTTVFHFTDLKDALHFKLAWS